MKKDCKFQYATKKQYNGRIIIYLDTDFITLNKAKKLWKKYLPQVIEEILNKDEPEMVIWINMKSPVDYKESLEWIDQNCETDGKRIWRTKRQYIEI